MGTRCLPLMRGRHLWHIITLVEWSSSLKGDTREMWIRGIIYVSLSFVHVNQVKEICSLAGRRAPTY